MLFKNLQREGYVGVYDSVQRFVKQWKSQDRGSQGAFVPLVFIARRRLPVRLEQAGDVGRDIAGSEC